MAGSRETSGITMLQKLVLANLVASLLLAMNVAFADTALLVADGVLVEKNPEIVLLPVPEVPGEEVAEREGPVFPHELQSGH